MAPLKKVAEGLRPRFPRTATLLEVAEDVLAYRLFPSEHQRQVHSTNVLVWDTALAAVPSRCGRALQHHSDGSVHVATSSGKLRANFRPLTADR